jgi:hypothetical protein
MEEQIQLHDRPILGAIATTLLHLSRARQHTGVDYL